LQKKISFNNFVETRMQEIDHTRKIDMESNPGDGTTFTIKIPSNATKRIDSFFILAGCHIFIPHFQEG